MGRLQPMSHGCTNIIIIIDLELRDIVDGATFINDCSWIYPMDIKYGSGTNMTTYILRAFSIRHQWMMREPGMTKECL